MPDTFSKQTTALTIDGPKVAFTMPDVPAGDAWIDFSPGAARVTPRIARCGLKTCAAGQVRPAPLRVSIRP